jgi:hypothetical protein
MHIRHDGRSETPRRFVDPPTEPFVLDITVKLADTPALGHFSIRQPSGHSTAHTDSLLALFLTSFRNTHLIADRSRDR